METLLRPHAVPDPQQAALTGERATAWCRLPCFRPARPRICVRSRQRAPICHESTPNPPISERIRHVRGEIAANRSILGRNGRNPTETADFRVFFVQTTRNRRWKGESEGEGGVFPLTSGSGAVWRNGSEAGASGSSESRAGVAVCARVPSPRPYPGPPYPPVLSQKRSGCRGVCVQRGRREAAVSRRAPVGVARIGGEERDRTRHRDPSESPYQPRTAPATPLRAA